MADPVPAPGDVLITKRGSDGQFEISIVPGNPQLFVRQKFEAVRQAHAFAEQTGNAVWFTESGATYTKVERPARKES